MSVRETRIWVLITDGMTARICSTDDGAATPILTPLFPTSASEHCHEDDRHDRLYRAWFKSQSQTAIGGSPQRQFALHLAQILHEAVTDRAFDGLIIIAAPQVLPVLGSALSPATRALLIGEIVRDLPNFDSAEKDFALELRH